jgi:1,4-dihydroxy-2-naphthoyl-CoA synthase
MAVQGAPYIYVISRLRVKYAIGGGYLFRPLRGHLHANHKLTIRSNLKHMKFQHTMGSMGLYNGGYGSNQIKTVLFGKTHRCFGGIAYSVCGPGSSVGIATGYGLDGPGIEFR